MPSYKIHEHVYRDPCSVLLYQDLPTGVLDSNVGIYHICARPTSVLKGICYAIYHYCYLNDRIQCKRTLVFWRALSPKDPSQPVGPSIRHRAYQAELRRRVQLDELGRKSKIASRKANLQGKNDCYAKIHCQTGNLFRWSPNNRSEPIMWQTVLASLLGCYVSK